MNKIHNISFNSFSDSFFFSFSNTFVWLFTEFISLKMLRKEYRNSFAMGSLNFKLQFLAHLGQRLKWTFLIKICPLMSIIIIIIVIVIDIACLNFSYFIFLRTPWPNSTKLFLKHRWNKGFQNFLKIYGHWVYSKG